MNIYMQRSGGVLMPCYSDDMDKLMKMKEGQDYKVSITRPRNIKHHRKYWALLNLCMDNMPEHLDDHFRSVDDLHFEIKLQCGYREIYHTMGGHVVYRAKSINFEKMDQTAFEEFYDKALDVIIRHIIPIEKEELINQITGF